MEAVTLNKNVAEQLKSSFEEERYETQGRSKRIGNGVYKYRGKKVMRVKIPPSLTTKLQKSEYIYYGWKVEGVDDVIFKKKSTALDFIDGFIA